MPASAWGAPITTSPSASQIVMTATDTIQVSGRRRATTAATTTSTAVPGPT